MPTGNSSRTEKLEEMLRRFRQIYGGGGVTVLRAPARINILGEHVDYVSYLPTASLAFGSREHAMLMTFRPRDDGKIRGASLNERFEPFEFDLNESETPNRNEKNWEEFVFSRAIPAPHWSNYAKGAVSFAQWKYGANIRRGFSFLVDSTIPPNSGASSSSALMVLASAAIRQVNQIEFSRQEIAEDSSEAEWFMGTRGGALDHTAISLAESDIAIYISYAGNCSRPETLPGEHHRWLTFFTHSADKGAEIKLEYNERAAISRLIIPAMIQTWKTEKPRLMLIWLQKLAHLRNGDMNAADELQIMLNYLPERISLDVLRKLHPKTFQECATAFPDLVRERHSSQLKLRDRALHHLGEVWRVDEAAGLLVNANRDYYIEDVMRSIGELINQSHSSLRDLYDVSTVEVERLIEVIRNDERVYGARLMGGGFGGNVLALTKADNVQTLIDRVQREYYSPQNRDGVAEGSVMISTPGDGLSEVEH